MTSCNCITVMSTPASVYHRDVGALENLSFTSAQVHISAIMLQDGHIRNNHDHQTTGCSRYRQIAGAKSSIPRYGKATAVTRNCRSLCVNAW